jgi:hypothetical protein
MRDAMLLVLLFPNTLYDKKHIAIIGRLLGLGNNSRIIYFEVLFTPKHN